MIFAAPCSIPFRKQFNHKNLLESDFGEEYPIYDVTNWKSQIEMPIGTLVTCRQKYHCICHDRQDKLFSISTFIHQVYISLNKYVNLKIEMFFQYTAKMSASPPGLDTNGFKWLDFYTRDVGHNLM